MLKLGQDFFKSIIGGGGGAAFKDLHKNYSEIYLECLF